MQFILKMTDIYTCINRNQMFPSQLLNIKQFITDKPPYIPTFVASNHLLHQKHQKMLKTGHVLQQKNQTNAKKLLDKTAKN